MAKTKDKETTDSKEGNIENLIGLKREFQKNEMAPRKLVALKNKLVELYNVKTINAPEQELMEIIFKKERKNGVIIDKHLELFNRIEMARCTDICRVKTDDVPRTHYLYKDQLCKFYKDDDADKFVVFVERKIPPEWQMSRELVLKEHRGHFASEEEYPKEKTLIHRLNLSEKEFKAWFDFEEDLLSEPTKKVEEEYQF